MNYIRHLTTFYAFVKNDHRLTPFHISLYMAIFQYWNFNRFQTTFPVYRENLMQLSRIGSKNTYHKCIRELHQSRYIHYHPPLSKFQPIKISVIRLCSDEEKEHPQLDLFNTNTKSSTLSHTNLKTGNGSHLTNTSRKSDTAKDPQLGRNIKLNDKHINSVCKHTSAKNEKMKWNTIPDIPNLTQVEKFFQAQNHELEEARKFFWFNQAKNWILTGQTPISDWKAVAQKWILNLQSNQHAKDSNFLQQPFNIKKNGATKSNNPENNYDYKEPL